MAKVSNPRKIFQFQIFMAGLNPFLAQEVKIPDIEIDQVNHGDTNYDVKTAGRVSVGNMTINKLCPSTPFDRGALEDMREIQNTFLGGGTIPDVYKKVVTVAQYANDGVTILMSWVYEGVWPTKLNGVEFSRTKSENTIESIEFSVDRVI